MAKEGRRPTPRPGGRGPGRQVFTGQKAKDAKNTIKRILGYLKKRYILIALVVIASILATFANLLIPRIFADGIDNYIMKLDYQGIFRVGVMLIVVGAASGFFSWVQNYVMASVTQDTVKEIREDAFLKLQKLPVKYYDSNAKGQIMSRLTNDIELIANALSQSVVQIFTSIITVIGALVLLFLASWQLAVITVLFLPVIAILTIMIAKRTFPLFKAQQKHLAEINGVVEESIQGFKEIKLYSQEENVIADFEVKNQNFKKASFKAMLYSGLIFPMINFLNNLIYVVLVIAGAFMSIRYGIITPGDIVASTAYARQFVRPISNLSQLVNTIQAAIAGAERVFALIDEKDEYLVDHDYIKDVLDGEIRFEGVTFAYDEIPVLEDINFWVKRNQVVAIVGPTGGGKTTIINLINRFYDIDKGEITVDGINIKEFKKDEYRKSVGVVFQDTKLFTGTVYDNIRYGKLDATEEEVIRAARYANCDGFISRLPNGYQTQVEEGGSNFSHGERQLISIARTILSDPDILILDEATSSVDTKTEKNIQDSMRKLMKGRTSIVIAHRLQTILNADAILVVKDGKIIERGTHKHLMEQDGFYKEMYDIQFKQI